mmetsp:Transcript_15103/g.33210  ORF Transcript_15103/g.33210 Transcript_15103/m.33210 type:complete len:262 (-) Transcript_15103:271-1056(-)
MTQLFAYLASKDRCHTQCCWSRCNDPVGHLMDVLLSFWQAVCRAPSTPDLLRGPGIGFAEMEYNATLASSKAFKPRPWWANSLESLLAQLHRNSVRRSAQMLSSAAPDKAVVLLETRLPTYPPNKLQGSREGIRLHCAGHSTHDLVNTEGPKCPKQWSQSPSPLTSVHGLHDWAEEVNRRHFTRPAFGFDGAQGVREEPASQRMPHQHQVGHPRHSPQLTHGCRGEAGLLRQPQGSCGQRVKELRWHLMMAAPGDGDRCAA